MNTYARIENGTVMELFETVSIDGLFNAALVWIDVTNASPQPQQNWTYDGSTFKAPVASSAPTTAQQAASMLAAGLQINSTSTPAIDGTYAVDQLSQMDIIAIETSLSAGKGFPGGVTTFNYPDASGVMHAFSQANFTDFAAAVRDFVYTLKSVMAEASSSLPSASSTIS